MEIIIIDQQSIQPHIFSNEDIASFLFQQLDQFGDKKELILKCLDYVFNSERGGFVIIAYQDGKIGGAVVVNETGMSGYIPENILVYIAVDKAQIGRAHV